VATHASAEKRHRQSLKRRVRNRATRTKLQGEVRKLHEAIDGKDPKKAEDQLRKAVSTLMRTAAKGVIHKRTASRRAGRLARAVQRKAAQA